METFNNAYEVQHVLARTCNCKGFLCAIPSGEEAAIRQIMEEVKAIFGLKISIYINPRRGHEAEVKVYIQRTRENDQLVWKIASWLAEPKPALERAWLEAGLKRQEVDYWRVVYSYDYYDPHDQWVSKRIFTHRETIATCDVS